MGKDQKVTALAGRNAAASLKGSQRLTWPGR
jgi:hypothetical protein